MQGTNKVAETEEQAVSPKKRITFSSDPDLFFHTDAAAQISDQQEHTEGQRKRLQEDMFNAIHTGELDAYDMRTGALLHLPFELSAPLPVRVADVNGWAKRTGRDWRWVSPNVKPRVTGVTAEAVVATASVETGLLLPSIVTVVAQGTVAPIRDDPGWSLTKPKRFQGYGKSLYDLLKAAHAAGQPRPKARDILDAWAKNRPPEVTEIMSDGIKYDAANGNTKIADLDAIRATINRMTQV